MGKKDLNEGWGTYNGKSRKSASWGDEIKGGWDLGGSSSISFSADKGSAMQKQPQVNGDLEWGGDSKRKKKGGWFDTHDNHRDGDKKDAVDSSVSWGGVTSAKSTSWADTHDDHRDGDKKNAVDSTVSWGGFTSAKSTGWADTHDDHHEGDKKNAVDSSVSWGEASSAKSTGWADTHDDSEPSVVTWKNPTTSVTSKTNNSSEYYDRTLYDNACLAHSIRKKVTLILVLGIAIFMGINVSFGAAIGMLVGLGVPALFYVLFRSQDDEMYQLSFLQPYVLYNFSGTYHDSFDLNLMEAVSYLSDREVVEAWRDFKIISVAPGIEVICAIKGKISDLPVNIYSYRKKYPVESNVNNADQSKSYVFIKLPLKGFVLNPIRISKSFGNSNSPYSNSRTVYNLEIKCKNALLNEKAKTLDDLTSEEDSIEMDDIYGKLIQSDEFLRGVSDAFDDVGGMPTLFFYDNYAYLYMEVPDRLYSKYDHGEKYKEVEKLDADTHTYLPLCKRLLALDSVFGES